MGQRTTQIFRPLFYVEWLLMSRIYYNSILYQDEVERDDVEKETARPLGVRPEGTPWCRRTARPVAGTTSPLNPEFVLAGR